jgi:hypothetical protein
MVYWSALILVLANLGPLYGVAFLDWNMLVMVLVYWCESGIVAFFTILKLLFAKKNSSYLKINPYVESTKLHIESKLGKAAFFTMHFGLFMFGHLVFIFILFFNDSNAIDDSALDATLRSFSQSLILLFIGHGAAFFMNYIRNKEYLRAEADFLIWSAYQRVIYMHLVVMGCAFLSFLAFTNTPVIFMSFAVLLKMVTDLYSYFKVQRAAQKTLS